MPSSMARMQLTRGNITGKERHLRMDKMAVFMAGEKRHLKCPLPLIHQNAAGPIFTRPGSGSARVTYMLVHKARP